MPDNLSLYTHAHAHTCTHTHTQHTDTSQDHWCEQVDRTVPSEVQETVASAPEDTYVPVTVHKDTESNTAATTAHKDTESNNHSSAPVAATLLAPFTLLVAAFSALVAVQ